MPELQRKRRREILPSPSPGGRCPECTHHSGGHRHAHWLQMAAAGSLADVEQHLRLAWPVGAQAITGVLDWLSGTMALWGGMTDAATGAPLPWYDARRQTLRLETQHGSPQRPPAPAGGRPAADLSDVWGADFAPAPDEWPPDPACDPEDLHPARERDWGGPRQPVAGLRRAHP